MAQSHSKKVNYTVTQSHSHSHTVKQLQNITVIVTVNLREVEVSTEGLVPADGQTFKKEKPDFRSTPMKSGFNTVRLSLRFTGIFFTVLIKKSEKQLKVLRVCLANLATGDPSGNQAF